MHERVGRFDAWLDDDASASTAITPGPGINDANDSERRHAREMSPRCRYADDPVSVCSVRALEETGAR
jgi:hypothetical protein